MRRWTLAASLGMVALFAIGFAALRSASMAWTSTVLTLTLGVLATGLIGCILKQWRDGPWLGFTVFGSLYFISTQFLWISGREGLFRPSLLSTIGFSALFERMHPLRPEPSSDPAAYSSREQGDRIWKEYEAWRTERFEKSTRFIQTGDSLAALAAAFVGAFVGKFVQALGVQRISDA